MAQSPTSKIPNVPSFVKVILKVNNSGGGTAKPGDFSINVDGDNNPNPSEFDGRQNGTIVAMTGKGKYSVQVHQDGPVKYGKSYSSDCALNVGIFEHYGAGGAAIKDGEKQTCIVTMIYPNFK